MRNKLKRYLHPVLPLLGLLILVSCNPIGQSFPQDHPSKEPVQSIILSDSIQTPDQTIASTETPLSNSPATISLPEVTPAVVGTPISQNRQVITSTNIQNLANVARWGKGSILGVAFLPDGSSFIVGSAYGLAIYKIKDLENASIWIPFEQPVIYEDMVVNEEGTMVLIGGNTLSQGPHQIRQIDTGKIVEIQPSEVKWDISTLAKGDWYRENILSPDNTLVFRSEVEVDEHIPDIGYSIRKVYDAETEELLYTLPDQTIQVNYSDRGKPQGCDLEVYSPCANALLPTPSLPYRVSFSSSNETLAILYRAADEETNQFSTLRLYDARNGKLMSKIGSFDDPVETFAYSPDGNLLLVGYVSGMVQLWDTNKNIEIFNAWDFNSPILNLEYSYDGKYIAIQRSGVVEIHLARDGSLINRYGAVVYSLSSTDYRLALGDKDGNLRLLNIDTGDTVFNINAHTKEIYAIVFNLDGTRITTSGEDCAVRNWNAKTGEFIHYFEENSTDAYMGQDTESRILIYSMSYLPDTDYLLGIGSWERFVNWDVNSGKTNFLIEPEQFGLYQGMININPQFPENFGVNFDKKEYYVDQTIYDIDTGEQKGEYSRPENLPENCILIRPITQDEKTIIAVGYENKNGQICMVEDDNYRVLFYFDVLQPMLTNYYHFINSVYISPNYDQLLISLSDGMLYVYQIVQ